MGLKIAIQGIKGSNHYQVTKDYYTEAVELVECMSFDALVWQLLNGAANEAIMAIENSIAGSIIPNYALVYNNKLHISGEYYLNIHHNLMVKKGQKIEEIKEVHSHPMALLQCKDFLKNYPQMKLVEAVDTAEVAKRIQENNLSGVAAIAPSGAATLYDLEIIASEIQTISNNATRFIILKREKDIDSDRAIDKASLRFVLDHKRGSLAAVLNVLSDCDLNLTKIQSLPIIEQPWKYAFFVDVTFKKYGDYTKAKSLVEIMAEEFMVLGEYKNRRV